MFGLFKRKHPREKRLKLHDVEADLRDVTHKNMSAHLWQSRWSDGTGKMRVWIPKVRDGWDGAKTAVLFADGQEVGEFPLARRELDFRWQGVVTPEMPKLEMGSKVRLQVGGIAFEGIVEAD